MCKCLEIQKCISKLCKIKCLELQKCICKLCKTKCLELQKCICELCKIKCQHFKVDQALKIDFDFHRNLELHCAFRSYWSSIKSTVCLYVLLIKHQIYIVPVGSTGQASNLHCACRSY